MSWYRMLDAAPNGVFPIRPSEAREWNEKKHGIFAALNEFDGPRRIANLRRIRAVAVDIDQGSKDQMRARIATSPLEPSSVVETKGGYHVHWHLTDGRPEHWNALVLERLVPFFGADKNARDIARILRVPGFLHWKNPEDPFLIRRVYASSRRYTEREIAAAFPWVPSEKDREEVKQAASAARASGEVSGDSFWQRAHSLDCRYALPRLSGHWLCNGEEFDLKPQTNGNLNIFVGGKGTSCFVDADGRIGSSKDGGPSVVRWCRYYGHSWADIARGLKEVFDLEGA